MILQLIVVSAELLRAAHIFVTMVLGFLQNRVELGNDLVDFPLHAIDSSVLLNGRLAGELWISHSKEET